MTIRNINDTNYKEAIDAKGVTLVDFTAPWCPPCKALNPILDDLDQKYGKSVQIIKINVDDSPEVTSAYGIMSMPTVMLFKDSKPVEKFVGLRSKDFYEGLITNYIK
ncbi:thioredoxin [Paenibacillus albiflavus]|uniref:Thioredoxin n=1 Tax=Paenibacillus albiflavus TaxID=2545760 RepID=A0A4R4ERE6_9BACL|nr:thioredoxin [Paenibacillus albiflavus]TCZ80998.1 thioredoxin [Paenibacillus albiflavus]